MKDPSDSTKPKEGIAPTAGRRADDSSLFSLESLKIKETETAAQARKTNEDSGLIDLRALAALERQGENKSPLDVASVVAPADIFGATPGTPLIAPPPAAAVAAPPPGMASEGPKKNTGIIIGGAVVAVAAAVGIFMLTRGSAPAATTPTATPAATTAAPTVAQTAEPTPSEPTVAAVVPGQRPAATPTATATTDPAQAAPKPVVKGPMPKAAPKEPKEPAAPAAPPKPVDTCDLTCQMQRAVNKKK